MCAQLEENREHTSLVCCLFVGYKDSSGPVSVITYPLIIFHPERGLVECALVCAASKELGAEAVGTGRL